MEILKNCRKCGMATGSLHSYCQVCRLDAYKTPLVKAQTDETPKLKRSLLKAFALPLALLIGVVVGGGVAPFVQNLAMFLQSDEVTIELQVGQGAKGWLFTSNSFKAKVVLPQKLSDKARVKLEKFDNGAWVEEDSQEVENSTSVYLDHRYSNTKTQQVRVALYSGDRLVQTSNIKNVQGIKRPKNQSGMVDNVVYRYFTEAEYKSVTTPGCGSWCYGIWVSTPIQSRLTMWMEAGGKEISKKVYVTVTKAGTYQKAILPATKGGYGILRVISRPATALEIHLANTKKPASSPSKTDNAVNANCSEYAVYLTQLHELNESYSAYRSGYLRYRYKFNSSDNYNDISAADSYYEGMEAVSDSILELKETILECYPGR